MKTTIQKHLQDTERQIPREPIWNIDVGRPKHPFVLPDNDYTRIDPEELLQQITPSVTSHGGKQN